MLETRSRQMALVLALATILCVFTLFPAQFAMLDESDQVVIGAPFQLTRHDGASVSDKNYAGKYMFIYFGFTHCPATCPTTLITMTQVLNELEQTDSDKAGNILPLFISIDPSRDTPELIHDYISNFHPKFEGLTGELNALEDMTNAYGSYFEFEEPDNTGNYNVNHSAYIYLMGRDGQYLTHFTPDETKLQILEEIKRLIS